MDEEQRRFAEELLFGKKSTSFAKKLYFGTFDPAEVFPFPRVSEEESRRVETLLAKWEAFADQELDPITIDREARIPDRVIEGLGRLGILGMTIPKEYGGLGMSQYGYCKVAEAIAKRCGSTALFLNAHQSVGLKALLLFGTEEQRKKWLPPLARGEQIAAFSLTEPNAGSDASGIETTADFDPIKEVYRINGKKQWTTNGSIAKVLTVMAQLEVDTPKGKQRKITAFLVTPTMPGFEVLDAALDKVGMRGSITSNLFYNNVEVPKENVLGPIGGGLKVCLTVLDYGRTTFGATCTGMGRACLEMAVLHAKNRYQFKRPLASFELVKKKIAWISAYLYAMESTTYLTAGLIDAGVEDVMLESAMLKVFASDSLWTILYETMQIYGGRSFFTDLSLERMMRDARLNMIGEGSNEVMRAFIGAVGVRDVGVFFQHVLDAAKHPVAEYAFLLKAAKQLIVRLAKPAIPVKSPLLKREALFLAKQVRSFGWRVAVLLAQHKEEILERQLMLDRIATSAMAIYTTSAVLSRVDRRIQENLATEEEIASAKLYCRLASDQVRWSERGMEKNFDQEIIGLSDQLTGVR